jgi:phytoene synthase
MWMVLHFETWENAVLTRAYEAFHSPPSEHFPAAEQSVYGEAYNYCARVIAVNSRTFYLASSLLPREKRRSVRALYAFCRATDDLIDQMPRQNDLDELLQNWQLRLRRYPNAYDPVPLAWSDTKARYRIPHGYEAQLVEGIARDLRQQRYATFEELAGYCYGVASTVGLMVIHIIDFGSEAALRYAVKLGIALQLTNILRDIRVDWEAGRLYLPLDELARFELAETDIARGYVDERWRAFMRFQIARARTLYAEAEPGIALLAPDGRFAIAAASRLYQGILDDIESHGYDVFRRRAHLSAWGKVQRLPSVWWRTRRLAQPGDLLAANTMTATGMPFERSGGD